MLTPLINRSTEVLITLATGRGGTAAIDAELKKRVAVWNCWKSIFTSGAVHVVASTASAIPRIQLS